jgi:hypothetical protein
LILFYWLHCRYFFVSQSVCLSVCFLLISLSFIFSLFVPFFWLLPVSVFLCQSLPSLCFPRLSFSIHFFFLHLGTFFQVKEQR